jgi:MbtH protein
VSNPFEDRDGSYLVLVNAERQYSLWPVAVAVPAGWTVAYGPDGRDASLSWIDRTWTDMRPASLAVAMGGQGMGG